MTKNMKKHLTVSVVIFILLCIFAGYRIIQLNDVPEVQASEGYPVETITAVTGDVSEGMWYVGTVDPWTKVDLAPKISARILNVSGKEGESIEMGQTAVTLDSGDMQGRINSLSKKVQTAKINLDYWNPQIEHYETLFEEGAISEQDLQQIIFKRDTAQSGYEEAQAALQEAHLSLENATIISPMTGVITAVHSNPGDMAVPGKPILTIADMEKLKVIVKVVEEGLIKLKQGIRVSLTTGSDEKKYSAAITSIFPTLDMTARMGLVEIAVPTVMMEENNLKAGMSINVLFVLEEKKDVIIVPKHTVKTEGDDTYVYIVDNGKSVQRKVKTGISSDRDIEIISGLNPGDENVTSGLTEIYDGRPLYIRR